MAKKRNKRRKVTLSDFGTPELQQRAQSVRYENTDLRLGSPKRMRITSQTPLDRYFQREQITKRQFDAGQEFYQLWRRAGRAQRVTSNYDAVIVDGSAASDSNEAFSDYVATLRDLGRDLGNIAQWICVEGMDANKWAEQNDHDPRGGITLLRVTLTALGDKFGMPRN